MYVYVCTDVCVNSHRVVNGLQATVGENVFPEGSHRSIRGNHASLLLIWHHHVYVQGYPPKVTVVKEVKPKASLPILVTAL